MSLITKGLGRAGGGSAGGGIGQIVCDLEGTVRDDINIVGTVEPVELIGVVSDDSDIMGEVVIETIPGVIQSEDIEGKIECPK